jgi:hypothetical protein
MTAKLMDYIHTWLNKWRMQEFHQKQGAVAST